MSSEPFRGDLPFRPRKPMSRFFTHRMDVPKRLYRAQYAFPAHLVEGIDIEAEDATSMPEEDDVFVQAVERAAHNTFNREGPFLLAVASQENAETLALTFEHSEIVTFDTATISTDNMIKISMVANHYDIKLDRDADQKETQQDGWLILHRIPQQAIVSRIDRAGIVRSERIYQSVEPLD